jgi:hypothetical protein
MTHQENWALRSFRRCHCLAYEAEGQQIALRAYQTLSLPGVLKAERAEIALRAYQTLSLPG